MQLVTALFFHYFITLVVKHFNLYNGNAQGGGKDNVIRIHVPMN